MGPEIDTTCLAWNSRKAMSATMYVVYFEIAAF